MSLRLATLIVASAVVHGAALTAPFAVRREPPAIMVELASHPLSATAAVPAPWRGDPAPGAAGPQAPAELPPATDSPIAVSARSDPAALPDEPAPPRSLPVSRIGAPDLASPAASRRIPPPLDGRRPLLADRGFQPVQAHAPVAEDVSALALPGAEARRLASRGAPDQPWLPATAIGLGPGDSKVTAGDRGREARPAVGAGDAGIPAAAIARLIGSRSGGGGDGVPGEAVPGEAGGASEGRGANRTALTSIAGPPEGGDEREPPVDSGDGTRAADARAEAREGAVGPSGSAPDPRSPGDPSPLALAGAVGTGLAPSEYGPYLRRLRSQIEDTIKYPWAARRRRLAGTVLVELVVRPSGEIEHVAVVGSSHYALLDNAAIEAIRALHPLPFPAELPRRPLRVQLPIVFDFR